MSITKKFAVVFLAGIIGLCALELGDRLSVPGVIERMLAEGKNAYARARWSGERAPTPLPRAPRPRFLNGFSGTSSSARRASKLLSIFENPALWHGADAMMKRP